MHLSRRARKDERGAAAVEFALIALPLILLMFIIVESAFLMKDYVSVSSAVRTGARTASAAADGGPGTCAASASPPPCSPATVPAFAQGAADSIQTTATALDSPTTSTSSSSTSPVANGYPSGQSTLTCGSNCVKYVWDSGLSQVPLRQWQLGLRVGQRLPQRPRPRQRRGRACRSTHRMVSGFFGTTKTIEERTLMQFEPLEQDRCKPGTPTRTSDRVSHERSPTILRPRRRDPTSAARPW